jgi:hypothetical protein
MWNASFLLLKGFIPEPCFWGQNYSSMIEAYLASPLIAIFRKPNIFLPLVTTILSLFPLCLFVFKSKGFNSSLLLVSVVSSISPRFFYITSMPRGFIIGIFFVAIGTYSVFSKLSTLRFIIFSFFNTLGLFLMPNSLPLVVATISIVVYKNILNRSLYIGFFIGTLFGLIYPSYVWFFYKYYRPEYLTFPSFESISFNLNSFKTALRNNYLYFSDVVPFYTINYMVSICFILFLILYSWHINYKEISISIIVTATICIVILFNPKVHNATNSIYYSYSRFFLALPYCFALWCAYLNITNYKIATNIICWIILFININNINSFSNYNLINELSLPNPVSPIKVKDLKTAVKKIKQVNKIHSPEAWIFNEHQRIYGLATTALFYPQDPIVYIANDRRRWYIDKYYDRNFKKFAGFGFSINESSKIKVTATDDKNIILIENLNGNLPVTYKILSSSSG